MRYGMLLVETEIDLSDYEDDIIDFVRTHYTASRVFSNLPSPGPEDFRSLSESWTASDFAACFRYLEQNSRNWPRIAEELERVIAGSLLGTK